MLVFALQERLRNSSDELIRLGSIMGYITGAIIVLAGGVALEGWTTLANIYTKNPVQAEASFQPVMLITIAIVGAIYYPWGIWVGLTSWKALRSRQLPRALNYLGIVCGILMTAAHWIMMTGAATWILFLLNIIWFIWLGLVLIRE